ncbi:MAG: endonuclease III [Candidatus Woesebacteria bacterium]|nr:MAG: endonuclease III [Candidatus Woesebacteria bacterium]
MANYQKVIDVFKKNYKLVPLEFYGHDPYKTLISTLLSSRTKDDLTLKISKKIFKKASNIKKLDDLTESQIRDFIYPVGFYKTKAKYLKRLSKMVLNEFGGRIPNNRDDLMKLPGVGRKTANLVLNRAFKESAIAVDTHVHRITNILGWVNTKTPEQTEMVLNKTLPKKYWADLNRLFVSIGQQYRSERKLREFLKENKLI